MIAPSAVEYEAWTASVNGFFARAAELRHVWTIADDDGLAESNAPGYPVVFMWTSPRRAERALRLTGHDRCKVLQLTLADFPRQLTDLADTKMSIALDVTAAC